MSTVCHSFFFFKSVVVSKHSHHSLPFPSLPHYLIGFWSVVVYAQSKSVSLHQNGSDQREGRAFCKTVSLVGTTYVHSCTSRSTMQACLLVHSIALVAPPSSNLSFHAGCRHGLIVVGWLGRPGNYLKKRGRLDRFVALPPSTTEWFYFYCLSLLTSSFARHEASPRVCPTNHLVPLLVDPSKSTHTPNPNHAKAHTFHVILVVCFFSSIKMTKK